MTKLIDKILKEAGLNSDFIKVKEIKYFSPNGKKMPNGSHYHKGGFLHECKLNSEKFSINNNQYLITDKKTIVEAIHGEQYGLSDYRGGIIIFSTEVQFAQFDKNKLLNWFKMKIASFKNKFFTNKKLNKVINSFNSTENKKSGEKSVEDYIGAFSIGNFFHGRYIGDNGKVFDEKSLSIEINGISSDGLIYLGEEIAKEFNQETVLVKDLNKNKIFLVDSNKEGNYDENTVNKKV